MNTFAILLFIVTAAVLLAVRRNLAPVPLLAGFCYMTMGQSIDIGQINMPVYRMLLAVGVVRVMIRGEHLPGRANRIDKLMMGWAAWVLFASFFHDQAPGSGVKYSAGIILDIGLAYFLIRIWCRDVQEVASVLKITAILLAPLALEMVFELVAGKNLFAVFGDVSQYVVEREGRLRAQGPFRHPILAGTVGATFFPLMIGIWREHRPFALLGGFASLLMVVASASSGPVMSLLVGVFGVVMWRFRHLTRTTRRVVVGAYLVLGIVMSHPPYYLIARIDVTGGSTGWHRAYLIDTTFKHLSEWWLFGTDNTRNWMPVGLASTGQADITNYYIGFALLGGLLSMLLVIAIMWRAFRWVGDILDRPSETRETDKFMIWCLGSGLLAHAAASVSVCYFDQSMIFFWLNVAAISSIYSMFSVPASPVCESPESIEVTNPVVFAGAR